MSILDYIVAWAIISWLCFTPFLVILLFRFILHGDDKRKERELRESVERGFRRMREQ